MFWFADSRPTTRLALGLVGLAALGVGAWFVTPTLRAWIPNVTVGAVTVAATITIVDRTIQREAILRVSPRVESVMETIRGSLRWLLWSIAYDFIEASDENVEPLPSDAVALTDAWIETETNDWEDRRALPRDDALPLIVQHALQLVSDLEQIRDRDRDVLAASVIRDMDDFTAAIERATFLYEVVDPESRSEARSRLALLTRAIVYATHNLALGFVRENPDVITLEESVGAGIRDLVKRRRK